MKYIDAEKLIAEIERFSATEYGGNTFGDDVANGALDYVLDEIIPSLQQEQPEVDLEKEFKKMYMKCSKKELASMMAERDKYMSPEACKEFEPKTE